MSRNIDPATLAAMSSQHIKWMVLARVEFDSGTLAFNSGLDDVDFDGVTYIGAGSLGNVSPAPESGSLNPSNYQITLSGISDAIVSAASTEQYLNKKAVARLAILDDTRAIIGRPLLWFSGLTDSLRINHGPISEVVIQVRNRLADWSRPRIERYTDQEQKNEFPNDDGLEYVADVASKEVVWPARTWFEKNA